jgi:hypothetical protein
VASGSHARFRPSLRNFLGAFTAPFGRVFDALGVIDTVAAATSIAPNAANPWGHQRSDETLLTGTTAEQVRAAALGAVSGGAIVRVETDADGHALYEAHMTKADGTPATVYVDKSLNVVSVETR